MIQSRTIRFVHKSTREVSVGGRWEIRVLMEQTLSLHYVAEIPLSLRYTPLKRSFLLTPLRSGFVPLAPVGHALDCYTPEGSQ